MQQRWRRADGWWRADDTVSRGPAWVALDVGVALLSAWIAVGDSDSTASVDSGPLLVRLAAALWFVAIALRRFAPATCLAAAAVATVLAAAVDEPLTNLSLASALALAMVVRTRPAAAAALLAVGPVAAALAALLTSPEGRSTWALAALVHLAAALWGVSSRRAARNRARVEQLSREQAVHAERARLALDLHDAIGHAVTRMLTCAGAARLSLPPGADAALTSLGLVEQAGRSAMQDLDRVLGLLRADGSGRATLEERLRALADVPGLTVSLRVAGGDRPEGLPPELEDAVHRLVQESLTNVLRHSSSRRVEVSLHRDDERLSVTVTDSGPAAPAPSAGATGRGLPGMRERVTGLGGSLSAGPVGPGWQVEAQIPVSGAPRR